MTLVHEGQVIKVGNLGRHGPELKATATAPAPAAGAADRLPDGRGQRADRRVDRFPAIPRGCWRLLPCGSSGTKPAGPWRSAWSRRGPAPRPGVWPASLGVDFHEGGLSTQT